jgi:hypothetical protein
MQYVEDSWDVQIQPIAFEYAYVVGQGENSVIAKTDLTQMKVRDKYVKIRIKYDGLKYALVHAIRTMFTISYA